MSGSTTHYAHTRSRPPTTSTSSMRGRTHDRFDSPTDALGELGRFISDNGGPEAWSEIDPYEVASCWQPYGEGTEISYSARIERVTVTEGLGWAASRTSRQPVPVTWRRLNAATFGALRRCDADMPLPDEEPQ